MSTPHETSRLCEVCRRWIGKNYPTRLCENDEGLVEILRALVGRCSGGTPWYGPSLLDAAKEIRLWMKGEYVRITNKEEVE